MIFKRNMPLRHHATGFTIIELLVATTILLIIMAIVFGITQQLSNAWKSTNSKIEAFQGARAAFDSITQNLGQATLNTYYDYYDASGSRRTSANKDTFSPSVYGRYSDLHFISGKSLVSTQVGHAVFFQTTAGYSDDSSYQNMDTLLNAFGYYVEYNKDPNVPAFLAGLPNKPTDRYRFRLMQFTQPSQNLSVYASTTGVSWFTDALAQSTPPVKPVADNIIALILEPKDSDGVDLTSDFEYDSRTGASTIPQPKTTHQLPPQVEVIMVVIDETSAKRLCTSTKAPDFGISTLFRNPSAVDANLQTLEGNLIKQHVTYRIFRTIVALRNAKWSS
jgi:uncharacterized protein (TIGR02599 family)